MNWKDSINDFKDYLRIERGLSNNSVLSYENDLKKLSTFLNSKGEEIKAVDVN
jgi:integrase/recombinase XerD